MIRKAYYSYISFADAERKAINQGLRVIRKIKNKKGQFVVFARGY